MLPQAEFVISLFLLDLVKCQLQFNFTSTTLRSTTINDLIFYNPEVLCKLQPIAYDCNKSGYNIPRYYYDVKLEDCKAGSFGNDCEYNFNQFKSIKACHSTCRLSGLDPIDYKLPFEISCRLQPDFGMCNSYHPMWYFDMTTRTCKGFSYSGCGGNMNRFQSSRLCTKRCRSLVE
ncbi:kunitz-type serine protease inhibitor bitisilin-3-like [Papilio machaon]|uniref:kunitz-type serine protease inhibitor bitisilin-3-like n=1 Tax=Papilio machaon TaxID=76193 RepID=UPI001E665DF5|nr:kunitz-type serine protease inhibitor bitisilin-3-like [Papilio machaon]